MHAKPGIGDTRIDFARPLDAHLLLQKICASVDERAGAPLARLAVAQVRASRFPAAIARKEPQWHCATRSILVTPSFGFWLRSVSISSVISCDAGAVRIYLDTALSD
jgi:hypothetical protein